jgi:tRNA threonylcarbamoyladenosine biosynthesis protein TsaE
MRHFARTAQDTEDFGAALARAQPQGAALAVVYLAGELGAGKTTLARGFLAARGIKADVRSPTYTLTETYPLEHSTVVHADLYRLKDPEELETLGLRDYAQEGYVWLIEWPERAGGRLPAADLSLSLIVRDVGHVIALEARSKLGEAWLSRLAVP